MATVAVVGAGAWGTALAIHAARMQHTVRLWTREPEVAASVERSRENTPFLPGFELPAAISVTLDHEQAVRG
ncbi:MAG TPA: glycerol-3-phosphate dehydrogenase, partial [Polyangiaceae bacterium]|nr:glycerol-3-phosphate dehydrogenase [Polyangiaceae bacterium]